jgi:zinc and cadmium transporter
VTSLLYALLAGAGTAAGAALVAGALPRRTLLHNYLVPFGAGFMLATVFVAMLPHAFRLGPSAALFVLAGYIGVHISQHTATPHFHFGEETHADAMVGRWVGWTAAFGLLLHAFFDGVAIGSGFAIDHALGVLIFTAVVLHKVPEGVTLGSVMLASGNTRRAAVAAGALVGAATVVGALVATGLARWTHHALAVSAGVTLYVAASNLVPEVQRQSGWRGGVALLAGAGLFLAARWLLGHPPHG